jgi:hypothetical protein
MIPYVGPGPSFNTHGEAREPMTNSAASPDAPTPKARAVATRLLLLERILMGLVLLTLGVAGLLGCLPKGTTQLGDGALVAGLVAKAGFCFPLLKGAEVLLEQYLAVRGLRS